MSEQTLPVPAPQTNPETTEFWEATASGKLLLRKCRSDGTVIWYPRSFCPVCHSFDTEWIEASGRGTIYSFTVNRRGDGPWREVAPFVVAYVELEEGPRILTNIVGDPEAVRIGHQVEVEFHDTGTGSALPRFHRV